jgi:hypothetical protein
MSFSQTLSFGFGSPSQQTSPQTKNRQEEKQICLPVLTKAVLVAANSGNDEFRIYGEEVSMLIMVGIAEAVVAQAASVEFILNDSTGRLKVRQYLTESNQNTVAFHTGQYVTVVGQVRTAPEVHVSAQFVSIIDSPDQISYHVIESTHAMLKLTRAKPDPMTPASKRPVATPQSSSMKAQEVMVVDTPQKESKFAASPSPNNTSKLSGDALRSALTSFLKHQGTNHPEGMEIRDIVKQMEPNVGADIRSCLVSLVSDGEVYNTIDDEHFSAL